MMGLIGFAVCSYIYNHYHSMRKSEAPKNVTNFNANTHYELLNAVSDNALLTDI